MVYGTLIDRWGDLIIEDIQVDRLDSVDSGSNLQAWESDSPVCLQRASPYSSFLVLGRIVHFFCGKS